MTELLNAEVHQELVHRATTQDNLAPLVLTRKQSRAERRKAFMSAVAQANAQYQRELAGQAVCNTQQNQMYQHA